MCFLLSTRYREVPNDTVGHLQLSQTAKLTREGFSLFKNIIEKTFEKFINYYPSRSQIFLTCEKEILLP